VIRSSDETDIVPFSCIHLFDSAERREFVRLKLINANIFPAILWSLDKPAIPGIANEYKDASRRMLSLHCDMRYGAQDMIRIAENIRNFGQNFDTSGGTTYEAI
jgi:hypothetical protein